MHALPVLPLLLAIGFDFLPVEAKKGKRNAAVLGTSIAAGIMVATLIILVFLCMVRKRKCRVPCRTEKKDKPRQPAKIPPPEQLYDEKKQQKLSDPEEPKYSVPYDHVKSPHYFNRNSGDYDYAVIEKSNSLPKHIVRESNNSLTITENDLYLPEGKGKQTRNSAGTFIVENECYSSAGTGK